MNETTDATAIFAPIWRRKWVILAVAVVVGVASYAYYKRQSPTYQATTQVFLGASAEEQAPSEKGSKKLGGTAVTNQAAVINSIVVESVRRQLRKEHKAVLARTTKIRAKSPEKSEFIAITTEAGSGRGAALVANLTAKIYIKRQTANREAAIQRAISISRRQLRRIEAAGVPKAPKPTAKKGGAATGAGAGNGTGASPPAGASSANVIQAANLSSKINQLESSLGTVGVEQVRPAKPRSSLLLSPKPRKDAIFGFVLGLVLAAIAAYAFSRFDRRLRSLAGIEAVVQAPLLAALPKVRRPIVGAGGSPRPSKQLLEPLRRLHSALQALGAPDPASSNPRSARVILFVSADPGDGKSTLAADLALIQRDAGERVVVVEANFRRPIQARLLGLEGAGQLAEVLTGRIDVDDAMQRVLPAQAAEPSISHGAGDGGIATAAQTGVGSLFVLAGDSSVANPPALLAGGSTAEVLRELADRFDYVLIDAPCPLAVSDAMPLLAIVEGIVVVARAGHTREASAQRLRQLLDRPSHAPVLGVVANFIPRGELKRYGFSSLNGRVRAGSKIRGR